MGAVSFTPRRFIPGRKVASTHWIGGWKGPGFFWILEKRKISALCQETNYSSVIQSVAYDNSIFRVDHCCHGNSVAALDES
jgi:hypothetical protein